MRHTTWPSISHIGDRAKIAQMNITRPQAALSLGSIPRAEHTNDRDHNGAPTILFIERITTLNYVV